MRIPYLPLIAIRLMKAFWLLSFILLSFCGTAAAQKSIAPVFLLRLAYHRLRAKSKEFTIYVITYFDKALPKIEVIAEDTGRVLLNLFIKAFCAIQQKSRQSQRMGYRPVVKLSACQIGHSIGILIRDNGTGISDGISRKITQSFFTAKPTGGGALNVNSEEGRSTEYKFILPM